MTDLDNSFQTLVEACENVVPAKLWLQHRAIVAVSGGADSVALFRTLIHIFKSNLSADRSTADCSQLVVAHVDHSVRGDASQADRNFVENLADQFGAKFVAMQLDAEELRRDREGVSEEAMRDARYDCLRKIAQDHNARYLFTGHHLNDQAETILFRIFRGTGLVGLKGIPAIRRDKWLTIVRPLLKIPKSELLRALDSLNQNYCTDATNATNDYGRNFIRNEILKSAGNYFGLPVEEAIARLADHATDATELEAGLVDEYFASFAPRVDSKRVVLLTSPLSAKPNSLIRAILIRTWQQQGWPLSQMTYDRWQQLAERICEADSPTRHVENLPGDLRFEVDSSEIRVTTKR